MKKNKSEKVKIEKDGIAIKKTIVMAGAFVLFLLLATGFIFQSQIRKNVSAKLITAGNYYFNGGAYDTGRAEKLFDMALKIDPQADAAYYQLARIHLVGNKLDLARVEIDESLAINPENLRAFYIRGLIDGYDQKYPDAISDFQKFVAWAPTEWAGYNDLAWVYYLNKDYEKTRETAQAGLDKAGQDNPWLLNGLGVAYVNLKQPQEAQKFFDQAKNLAADLTPQKWASAYPGNDPSRADFNLNKFRIDVNSNLQLALGGFTSGGIVASACGSSNPPSPPGCTPRCSCNACRGHICGSNGCGGNCLGNITGGGCSPSSPPNPVCVPNCGCAMGHCNSYTCNDGCGGTCRGNIGPDCPTPYSYCKGTKYDSSNGCGSCNGKKSPVYTNVCLYSDRDVCNQSNCNKEITTKTASCVGISDVRDVNGSLCLPSQKSKPSACGNTCQDQKITCPPCSWKEVAP